MTARAGGAQPTTVSLFVPSFQPTPPKRVAAWDSSPRSPCWCNFHPRYPRGWRHMYKVSLDYLTDFNPRHPRGWRPLNITAWSTNFYFNPHRLYGRRHNRESEGRGQGPTSLRRFSFPPPSHPAPMRKAACWPRADTHFIPRRPLSGQFSGIPMIWERPFHPRSPACRHQAGSLPISNPCFNPHGPFGR